MAVRCFKCLEDVAIVSSREGPKKSYCRTCFLDIYHKNVRDAFFRQCRIPPNIPIILAVSGGINSMAMMHSLGLLRVQNITRGGAGKIDFDMHILHMTGDDNENPASPEATRTAPSHSRQCAETVVRACTAVAPLHHVPQATTTKRRVQEKRQREANGQNPQVGEESANTTPLFEPSRVNVKKFSDYLPRFSDLSETFFSGTKPLTSVAMAEDLIYQFRTKAIVSAAQEVAAKIHKTRDLNSNADEQPFLLLFGDSAVKSGVEALYQLTRGRGQSILDHCGYRGNLFGKVFVRRPMRGLLPKESLFYCRIEGLETQWTPVPAPEQYELSQDQNVSASMWRLLQFCIATTSVHRDLTHLIVAAIKRQHAGTPLAVVSHKQKASVRSLLEEFVLNLSDGSYKSAIFNIIHSVDKMMGADDTPLAFSVCGPSHPDSVRGQPRFGPKNAGTFAHSTMTAAVSSCSLCGGQLPQCVVGGKACDEWSWCRSCRQILRPVFEKVESGEEKKEANEILSFLTEPNSQKSAEGLVKMSRAQIRAEISEYLLNNDDDE